MINYNNQKKLCANYETKLRYWRKLKNKMWVIGRDEKIVKCCVYFLKIWAPSIEAFFEIVDDILVFIGFFSDL